MEVLVTTASVVVIVFCVRAAFCFDTQKKQNREIISLLKDLRDSDKWE